MVDQELDPQRWYEYGESPVASRRQVGNLLLSRTSQFQQLAASEQARSNERRPRIRNSFDSNFCLNMLDIYVDPCTINCRKVLAGLDLVGCEYNEHFISYFKGEQKSPDYLKINPGATIPAASDGDAIIVESNAILMYASDLNSNNTTYPTDLKQRAVANAWLLWESSAWFPSCYIYLVENVVKPLLGNQPDQAIIAAQDPRFNQLATVLDKQLSQTKWILGDQPSIVDISIGAPMHLHAAQKLPLEAYPNINRWLGLLEALPSWQKTQGAVNDALLPKKS